MVADADGNVLVAPTAVKSRWLWFVLPAHPFVASSMFNWIASATITTLGNAAIVAVVRSAAVNISR